MSRDLVWNGLGFVPIGACNTSTGGACDCGCAQKHDIASIGGSLRGRPSIYGTAPSIRAQMPHGTDPGGRPMGRYDDVGAAYSPYGTSPGAGLYEYDQRHLAGRPSIYGTAPSIRAQMPHGTDPGGRPMGRYDDVGAAYSPYGTSPGAGLGRPLGAEKVPAIKVCDRLKQDGVIGAIEYGGCSMLAAGRTADQLCALLPEQIQPNCTGIVERLLQGETAWIRGEGSQPGFSAMDQATLREVTAHLPALTRRVLPSVRSSIGGWIHEETRNANPLAWVTVELPSGARVYAASNYYNRAGVLQGHAGPAMTIAEVAGSTPRRGDILMQLRTAGACPNGKVDVRGIQILGADRWYLASQVGEAPECAPEDAPLPPYMRVPGEGPPVRVPEDEEGGAPAKKGSSAWLLAAIPVAFALFSS